MSIDNSITELAVDESSQLKPKRDVKAILGCGLLCLYAIFTGILLVYQIPSTVDVSIQIIFVVLIALFTLVTIKELVTLNLVMLVVLATDLALLISSLHSTVNFLGVLRLLRVAILVL